MEAVKAKNFWYFVFGIAGIMAVILVTILSMTFLEVIVNVFYSVFINSVIVASVCIVAAWGVHAMLKIHDKTQPEGK